MRRGWWLAADGLLALAVCAIGLVGTANLGPRGGAIAPDRTAYALVVIAALALAGRRLAPLVTLAVATVATSTYLVLGYPYGPILLSVRWSRSTPWPGTCRCAERRSPALWRCPSCWCTSSSTPTTPLGIAGVIPGSAWVVVPFAVGVTVRLIRESAARTRADAGPRELRRRRSGCGSPRRCTTWSGTAWPRSTCRPRSRCTCWPSDPEQAEAALTAISRTSREALDELRVTLALVRRARRRRPRAPTPGPGPAGRPGGTGCPTAGVPVSVDVDGPAPGPAGGGRPGRVPGGAGVADQRAAPRRRGHRPRCG